MKRIIGIFLGLVAVCSVSCTKKEHGGDPVTPPKFSVKVNITDGLRTLDRMVDYAKVSVGLVSSNELESYTFTYQVEGGDEHVIRNMYNGMNRSLNADFRDCVKYGSYRLTGCASLDSNPEEKVLIDTTVWMKYVPLESQGVTATVRGERIPMDLVHENYFSIGDGGTLELAFLPVDSYANITCSSVNSDILLIDRSKAKIGRGLYTVPFVAAAEGTTTLSFVFANGPDLWEVSYVVNVVKGGGAPAADLSFEEPGLLLDPATVPFVVVSGTDTGDQLFNLEYYLDGICVAEEKVVKLQPRLECLLDISGLSVGMHQLKLVATYVTGELPPVTCACSFGVARPRLEMDGVMYKEGDDLKVELGKSYVFVLDGVPVEFYSLFTLSGADGDVVSAGDGRWTVRPTVFGRGDIKLSYVSGNVVKHVVSLDVLRIDVCKLTLSFDWKVSGEGDSRKADYAKLQLKVDTGKYAGLDGLQFSGMVVYGGVGDCIVAGIDEETDTLVNNDETRSTKETTLSILFTPLADGSVLSCDLSGAMDAILSDSFKTNVWKTGDDGTLIEELIEHEFRYDFRLIKVVINAETDYEGLVFGIVSEIGEGTQVVPGSSNVVVL